MKEGERVERDQPLVEVTTDKVDAEIPAPSAGVLAEIKVSEGQTVPVQTVVAVIETEAKGGVGDQGLGAGVTPSSAPVPAPPAKAPAPPKNAPAGSSN